MTTITPVITATIIARGVASEVPDNDGAVDAVVYADGSKVGECTLLPAENGDLASWGSIDQWADCDLSDWFDAGNSDLIANVVEAVRKADAILLH